MAQSRIYKVTAPGQNPRLIRAGTRAQATRHAVADTVVAEVASQDDLVSMLQDGATIESASGDPDQMDIEQAQT